MNDVVKKMIAAVRAPGPAREAAVATAWVVGVMSAIALVSRILEVVWGVSLFEVGAVVAMMVVGPVLWFLPAIIAGSRRHHQVGLVVGLSALGIVPVLGWATWLVALFVAAATPAQPSAQLVVVAPQVGYRPGDVANGHILSSDGRWVPVGALDPV